MAQQITLDSLRQMPPEEAQKIIRSMPLDQLQALKNPVQSQQKPSFEQSHIKSKLESMPLDKLVELRNMSPDERNKALEIPTTSESALRGFSQTITGNFADELSAGLQAGIDVGQSMLGLRGDISFKDAYRTNRDAIRRREGLASEANPASYGAGQLAGIAATALVPGAQALNVAKGAKLSTAAAKGALGSGIASAGASEADLLEGEYGDFLSDVASGAATGALFSSGLNVVSKSIPTIPTIAKKAKDSAGRLSFKAAVGNQQKYTDEAISKKNLIKTGQVLLDRGIVRFGDDAEAIAKKLEQAQANAGSAIGGVLDKIDDAAGKPIIETNKIAEAINDMADKLSAVERNKGVVRYLRNEAAKIAKNGNITLRKAQDLKNLFPYQFSATSNLSEKQIATNRINKLFSLAMDDAVEQVSKSAGKQFEYGAFSLAEEAARKLASRDQKNATIGLRDVILGGGVLGGGLAQENYATAGPGALAIGLASSLLRKRGNSALAVTLNSIGNKLSSSPESLGRYTRVLSNAARSGQLPLAATHLMLLQDPGYSAMVMADDTLRDKNIQLLDDIEDVFKRESNFSLPVENSPTFRLPGE